MLDYTEATRDVSGQIWLYISWQDPTTS